MIMVADIKRATARHYGLPVEAMSEPASVPGSLVRNRARSRQAAMYLASCLTTKSYVHIGRLFGGRDHSTVINAVQQTAKRLRSDKEIQDAMRCIAREVL